jgi:hypothetical protein
VRIRVKSITCILNKWVKENFKMRISNPEITVSKIPVYSEYSAHVEYSVSMKCNSSYSLSTEDILKEFIKYSKCELKQMESNKMLQLIDELKKIIEEN